MRISDWSSDVCSSDLPPITGRATFPEKRSTVFHAGAAANASLDGPSLAERLEATLPKTMAAWPQEAAGIRRAGRRRSEERRVGKECVRTGRSRWAPDH